jgi:hypothetical protein
VGSKVLLGLPQTGQALQVQAHRRTRVIGQVGDERRLAACVGSAHADPLRQRPLREDLVDLADQRIQRHIWLGQPGPGPAGRRHQRLGEHSLVGLVPGPSRGQKPQPRPGRLRIGAHLGELGGDPT